MSCKTLCRYLIGIDLGTTNSCVAYLDTDVQENPHSSIRIFPIPQLGENGLITCKSTLPSSLYLSEGKEFSSGVLDLPWSKDLDYVVGVFAREYGAKRPCHLVQSAKSWMCNPCVDRKERILPFGLAQNSRVVSPLQAAVHYLTHIKLAWNYVMAKGNSDHEFESQEVVLTVPASFDEVARSLTVEAAKLAGFGNMTLLEEPQAAFYHWMACGEKRKVKEGDRIVVCDIGGGTSDFSLIQVEKSDEDSLRFQRTAVGKHLLLGGDNMDEAIAYLLEKRLQEQSMGELSLDQWLQVKQQGRIAKERLLSREECSEVEVQLQGAGSSVVGGSHSCTLSKGELEKFLLDGFFTQEDLDQALNLKKGGGVRSMGLPYEAEASMNKHLASFLQRALPKGSGKGVEGPDYLLFNGGAVKPKVFQEAVARAVGRWSGKNPQILPAQDHDQAVAKGAAYFANVRRGNGQRIGGGSPRGYYLSIRTKEKAKQLLVLLPRGAEEGTYVESTLSFDLMPNTPVSFELMVSHTRLEDQEGDLVEFQEEEFSSLPPLHTILRYGKKKKLSKQSPIKVGLGVHFTEIGTLDLWIQSRQSDHKWALTFQLRNVAGQDDRLTSASTSLEGEVFAEGFLRQAKDLIAATFSQGTEIDPAQVVNQLEKLLEMPKEKWSPSILRGLWEALYMQANHRKISLAHEARWWNLAGFFLRPGFGHPLDDFRIKDLWRVILEDYQAERPHDISVQRWICYRRIAGGLSKGQQMQLAHFVLPRLLDLKTGKMQSQERGNVYEYREMLRALASMERLDLLMKERLGQALVEIICNNQIEGCEFWALGRLGARQLVYGSLSHVLPKELCMAWLKRLTRVSLIHSDSLAFVVGQLARQTDLRELNISLPTLHSIIKDFEDSSFIQHVEGLLKRQVVSDQKEVERVMGDSLPVGLALGV